MVAYVVVLPFNSGTYGVPAISATDLKNFVQDWENTNGAIQECTQTVVAPNGNGFIPEGTKIGLKNTLKDKQCVMCSEGTLTIKPCDTVAIWVHPIGFSSFEAHASLIIS